MRAFLANWRTQSREHPSVRVLTLAGLLGFVLGAILIAADMALVGELVAGVAVAPLTLALYLCLLPAGPWPDDDGGGGSPPGTPKQPNGGSDWEHFEREFWDYVDRRVPVA
jgi:hypothetical protein